MTVVLAAIAVKGDAIVMACDRMLARAQLTYQFEHDNTKVKKIDKYLVGYAGTTAFADDIASHQYSQFEEVH